MASTADIIGVYIAVDIMAAGTTAMPIVPMGIMAIAIAPTDTTVAIGDTDTTVAIGDMATMVAIGDTDIMVAIGPIAGIGRGVHIVDGADVRTGQSYELMKA